MILDITPPQAVLTCAAMACLFVGVLYAVPPSVRKLPRDDPEHVKWRMAGTSGAATISLVMVAYWSKPGTGAKYFTLIGMPDDGVLAAATLPLMLTACLFLGPIAQTYWEHTLAGMPLLPGRHWLVNVRTVFMAPLLEEFTFRACMLPLWVAAGFSITTTILCVPLVFGIAHLHHVFELIRQGQRPVIALLISMLQMTYTTLFGQFAAFLMARTGHVVAAIVVHCFCNFMGLPRLDFLWASHHHPLHSKKWVLVVLYLLGIVLFASGFWRLTDPALYGGSMYWPNDAPSVSTAQPASEPSLV